MNTTTLSPEDHYALSFFDWMSKYYVEYSVTQYYHISQIDVPQGQQIYLTPAECLAQFKSEYIPQLPPTTAHVDDKLIELATQTAERNKILMQGFLDLKSIVFGAPGPTIMKTGILEAIIQTMDKITNP